MHKMLYLKKTIPFGYNNPLSVKAALVGAACFVLGTVSSSAITATASDSQLPNVPANVLDGDLNTRWSAFGDPQWIQFDLASVQTVAAVDIAFFVGDTRGANFEIETSADGTTWSVAFAGQSSGETLALERYDIIDVEARYVRIVGRGNTINLWNSITEVEIDSFTVSVSASSFQNPNVPANTLDNDLSTRWSSDGFGEWIRYDFGSASRTISSLGVAFFRGDSRITFFDIEASGNGVDWIPLRSVVGSGNSLELERFSFPEVNARYIRLVGQGNSWNDWNSYTEVDLSNPTPTWAQFEELPGFLRGYIDDAAPLSNGGVVVVGDLPGSTAIVKRYDALGAELSTFDDNGSSFVGSISTPTLVTTGTNSDIVFVRSQAPTFDESEDSNIVVTKLNSSGAHQWDQTIDSSGSDTVDIGLDIEAMSNGSGYVVSGALGGNVDGEWTGSLIKLDNSGNIVWSKLYNDASLVGAGENFIEGVITEVAVTAQSDFLVIGNFTSINPGVSQRNIYQRALRLDSNGNIIWQTLLASWSGPDLGYLQGVVPHSYGAVELLDGSGSFALVETVNEFENNTFRVAILDSAGTLGSWGQSYVGIAGYRGGITADSDSGFSVGHSLSGNYGIHKFEADGSLVWSRAYGNPFLSHQIASMVLTSDSGYCLAGFYYDTGAFQDLPMLVKLDAGGGINQ